MWTTVELLSIFSILIAFFCPYGAAKSSSTACTSSNPAIQQLQKSVADPAFFCAYWGTKGRVRSPFDSLNVPAIYKACKCIDAHPGLVQVRLIHHRTPSKLVRNQCSSSDVSIVAMFNALAKPQRFCRFWAASRHRSKSPLHGLSAPKVSSACACAAKTPRVFSSAPRATTTGPVSTTETASRRVTTTHRSTSTKSFSSSASHGSSTVPTVNHAASTAVAAQSLPSGMDPRSTALLQPVDTQPLAFGSKDSTAVMAASSDVKFKYPSVMLDYSAFVASKQCRNNQMEITFSNKSALQMSLSAWASQEPILLVTYSAPCSSAGSMYMFLAHTVAAVAPLKLLVTGKSLSMDEAIESYNVAFGPPSSLPKKAFANGRIMAAVKSKPSLQRRDPTPSAPPQALLDMQQRSDLGTVFSEGIYSDGKYGIPPPSAGGVNMTNQVLDTSRLPPSIDSPWGYIPELSLNTTGEPLLQQAQMLQAEGQLLGSYPMTPAIRTYCLDCRGVGSFAITGSFDSASSVYNIQLDGNIDFYFLLAIDTTLAAVDHTAGIQWTPLLPSMQFGSLVTFAPQLLMTTTINISNTSPGQAEIGGHFTWSGNISLSTNVQSDDVQVSTAGDAVNWSFNSRGAPRGTFAMASDMFVWFPLSALSGDQHDMYLSDASSMTVQSSDYSTTCGGLMYATKTTGAMMLINPQGQSKLLTQPVESGVEPDICVPLMHPYRCNDHSIEGPSGQFWSVDKSSLYSTSANSTQTSSLQDCINSCDSSGPSCLSATWIVNSGACQLATNDIPKGNDSVPYYVPAYIASRSDNSSCTAPYGYLPPTATVAPINSMTFTSTATPTSTMATSLLNPTTTVSTVQATSTLTNTPTTTAMTFFTTTTSFTATTAQTTMTTTSASPTQTCAGQYVLATDGMVYDQYSTTKDLADGAAAPVVRSSLQSCADYCETLSRDQCIAVVWVQSGQSSQWCYPKNTTATKGNFGSDLLAYSIVRAAGAKVCPDTSTNMGS